MQHTDEKPPEIRIDRIPVGGGVAGLIFAVGSCLIFLVGIPAMRWFLLGSVAAGAVFAGFLWRWHKKRPVKITDIRDIYPFGRFAHHFTFASSMTPTRALG